MMVGTPSYMPPEQARAEKADGRADVYSLGATLYALTTGRPPFVGDNVVELLTDVVTRDPLPPRKLNPSLDADIETIILKAIEKEPARRYESAVALADDLDRFLRGDPVAARRASLAYRIRKRVRRQPLVFALGALLSLVLPCVPIGLLAQHSIAARRHAAEAERLLMIGDIESLIAADRHAEQAGDRELRSRVNRALGESALERANYDLARLAFAACGENADARIAERRDAERRRRKSRIEAALDDLRQGLRRDGRKPDAPLIDDYVDECAQFNDEQTVRMLAEALKPFVERAGGNEKWTEQERDVMKFSFRVLGRVRLASAVEPLAKMMDRIADAELAAVCGEALCTTRSPAAHAPLIAARKRLGSDSSAWRRIVRLFPHVPDGGTSKPTSVREFLDRGLDRYQQRDVDGAIEDYSRAIELDPRSAGAYSNRALARRDKRDFAGAVADWERFLELARDHPQAPAAREAIRKARAELKSAGATPNP